MKEDFKNKGEMTLKVFALFMFMFVILPLIIAYIFFGVIFK